MSLCREVELAACFIEYKHISSLCLKFLIIYELSIERSDKSLKLESIYRM